MGAVYELLRKLAHQLVRLQTERPWIMAVVALAMTAPAFFAARGLGLKTDFAELLPENKPSVVEMRRVSARLTSASTLTLVAEVDHPDAPALKAFADTVSARIRALGPEWVGTVDEGTQERRKFFDKNKLLYAPLSDIREVHDEIRERYDYEVQKVAGGDLDLGDPPPPITADEVRKRFQREAAKVEDHSDGYYLGEDDKLLAILVHTPVEPGSVEPAKRLRAKIDEMVAEVNPAKFDPSMKVRYTGDFITSVEEYQAVKDDLGHVGVWGVGMVLASVLLFFMRLRTLLAMGITVGIGLAWTFGATRLTIGYLNSSTGFLVSIIAGNGINFGIMYMARYLEARRYEKLAPGGAVRVAHRDTWLPTLAAAGAAMLSYGSLAVTDFRGFKHFGVIGGMGMILCWISTYLFLPVVLVLLERRKPMVLEEGSLRAKLRGVYGHGFAWLATRAPRAVTIVGLVTGLAGAALTVRYFAQDPIEYDMTKLRNERTDRSAAGALSERVDKIVGRIGQDGMAVMTDRVDQVLPLKAELDRRAAAAPADKKPFEQVVTIFDLVPKDQKDKLPLLADTRDVLLRARNRHMISDADWKELEPYVPAADLKSIGIDDLPEQMARSFTEKDGTRGRIVYIVPKEGRSVWDAHYLELWADSFRTVNLPNGEVIKGSGRAVIFADMIAAIVEDAPKAIAASLAGTLLVVFLAFRGRKATFAVLASLLLGVSWMFAYLSLHGMFDEGHFVWPPPGMKLNFLNFVALPITFGIGVDYAVNMMQRYRLEGDAKLRQVVVETGGAVVLCSLTTMLGYLALTLSMNQAIVSFGLAAAAGEVACLLAAVLVLPAALVWRARRRAKKRAEDAGALAA